MRDTDNVERDGWKEWSRHIINLLEHLDTQLNALRGEVNKANLDIAKLSYLNNSLAELEEKLHRLREEISVRDSDFKEAIASLEKDDLQNLKRVEDAISALTMKVEGLQTFMTRAKTIAWIIGSIMAALVGMLSFSLKDLFD